MYARERIIRDRFAKRSCGRCGAPYSSESVVILARRPSHWMVMVSCRDCSHRNVYLISFAEAESTHDASAIADADSPLASPPAAALSAPSIEPITEADVAAMHDFLHNFSGDFQTLFSTPRPHPQQHPYRKDDPPMS